MKKVLLLKRFSVIILFVTAVGATFTFITNMTPTDVMSLMDDRGGSDVRAAALNDVSRNTALEQKGKSSEENLAKETAKQLEKSIDLSDYPSKTVEATGYTAGIESTGKTADHPEYGITYSGLEVQRDLYSTIAADLDVYPLGTVLFIPDYGYGVVADKGEAITGNKIDLYYPTVADVYNHWGKKAVDVYVIQMGDGQLTQEEFNTLNNAEALEVFR